MSQSRKPQSAAVGGGGGRPGSPPPGAKPKGPRQEVVSARTLYFGNGDPAPETALARAISGRVQLHRITDDYIGHIDDSREYYNTLFVIGSDPVRIRKLMRIYRPLLKMKAKIVIMREVRPSVKAQLLNAGFDDVFDREMPVAEAAARVRACWAASPRASSRKSSRKSGTCIFSTSPESHCWAARRVSCPCSWPRAGHLCGAASLPSVAVRRIDRSARSRCKS